MSDKDLEHVKFPDLKGSWRIERPKISLPNNYPRIDTGMYELPSINLSKKGIADEFNRLAAGLGGGVSSNNELRQNVPNLKGIPECRC